MIKVGDRVRMLKNWWEFKKGDFVECIELHIDGVHKFKALDGCWNYLRPNSYEYIKDRYDTIIDKLKELDKVKEGIQSIQIYHDESGSVLTDGNIIMSFGKSNEVLTPEEALGNLIEEDTPKEKEFIIKGKKVSESTIENALAEYFKKESK